MLKRFLIAYSRGQRLKALHNLLGSATTLLPDCRGDLELCLFADAVANSIPFDAQALLETIVAKYPLHTTKFLVQDLMALSHLSLSFEEIAKNLTASDIDPRVQALLCEYTQNDPKHSFPGDTDLQLIFLARRKAFCQKHRHWVDAILPFSNPYSQIVPPITPQFPFLYVHWKEEVHIYDETSQCTLVDPCRGNFDKLNGPLAFCDMWAFSSAIAHDGLWDLIQNRPVFVLSAPLDLQLEYWGIPSLGQLRLASPCPVLNEYKNELLASAKDLSLLRRARRLPREGLLSFYKYVQFCGWQFGQKTIQKTTAYIASCIKPPTPIIRPLQSGPKKLKIAHITAQMIDIGHAPTPVLVNMCTQSDHERFEHEIIVTETPCQHPLDYPALPLRSDPSPQTGKKTLSSLPFPTFFADPHLPLHAAVDATLAILEERKVDIAIFHSEDPVNFLVAQKTSVPYKVYFELSVPAVYQAYDLFLCGDIRRLPQYGERGLKTQLFLDIRHRFKPHPPSRAMYGLPEGSPLLFTVSNSLSSRLTDVFGQMVLDILAKVPSAHYVCVGFANEALRRRFCHPRWHFVGVHPNTVQLLRMATLYLNEYPEGSGMALIEAMASGVPIISSYDEDLAKPTPCRLGANLIGFENCLPTPALYVKKAVRSLLDPNEWHKGHHLSLATYARLTNFRAQMQIIEDRIYTRLFVG